MKKVKDMFFEGKDIRGEVGIEVEMEGKAFPHEDLDSWYSREDGSLRGDSREYVLIRPCKREDVGERLLSLENDLKEESASIVNSPRTGVHVHINIRNLSFVEVFNFVFTYIMFEDILMQYAGKDRVGNLFCLRIADAECILGDIGRAIKNGSLDDLYSDNIRYSSMNLKAIKQYGSIEFRGLPFSGDFKQIHIWTNLLLAVKDYALTLETPRNLVENISKLGNKKLAEQVFKGLIEHLPDDQWHLMLDGIRRVQKLVYLNDWEYQTNYIVIKTTLEENKDEQNIKEPIKLRRQRAPEAALFQVAGLRLPQ